MSNTPQTPQSPVQPGILAEQLRAARGELLGKDLAARAGWPLSKVSKIEHGKQLPSQDDLAIWAQATGTTADLHQWRALLQAAEEARRDLSMQTRAGHRALQHRFNEIIARADRFRSFETTVIPRFLQLPDYTRAVLTESRERHGGADDLEAAVAERQASVAYLFDPARSFEFLIAEPVLGWRFRALSRQVHRAQLEHLLTLQGRFRNASNVRMGIVPLFRPISWAPRTPFNILGDYAAAEHWIGEQQFLLNDETDRLHKIMDKMWETACQGEAAARIIRSAIDRLDQSDD